VKTQARGLLQRLLIFLSVVGPGIITANVDNDAGGITTYSVAGAHFGYSLLWSFAPVFFALVVIQEMCSRMAVATGKGLADLIREQFGIRVTFYAMLVLVLSNLFNTISEFAGIAAAADLFGASRFIFVPASALLVWGIVVKGNYKSVEKVFLVACFFYVSYVLSGLLSRPSWAEVGRAVAKPAFSLDRAWLFTLVGVVGTTIAPWMQFYQQSSVVEKGIKAEYYRYARLDVIVGAIVVSAVAVFIVITCANTLYAAGVRIETARDAAVALRPLAGDYCYYLFAFGLLNASVFSACILPLSTAYSVCEGMGWELGVNRRFREAPQFYVLYTAIIVVGAGAILLPGVQLVAVMLLSQVTNGVLLPFVLIFMLRLVNNRSLMGDHVNGRFANVLTVATVVVMIGLSAALLVTSLS
jgi:Mn2+/Fe2+ NRAMP family transporter